MSGVCHEGDGRASNGSAGHTFNELADKSQSISDSRFPSMRKFVRNTICLSNMNYLSHVKYVLFASKFPQ